MFETIRTGQPTERPPTRYTDREYAEILDGIVFCCADIIILNPNDEILMARRTYEPAKDTLWIVGGRMRFGESFQQAAGRNLKREMGIDVDPTRFKPFTTQNYVWGQRAQPPVENGSHNVSVIHLLRLAWEEIAQLAPNEEYAGNLIWRKLIDVLVSKTDHPAMIQTMVDLADAIQRI